MSTIQVPAPKGSGFFSSIGKFIYDHFTDKSGFWDEKRTTGFALILIALGYGVFHWFGEHPDVTIFSVTMGAGTANYFAAAYNDARNPLQSVVSGLANSALGALGPVLGTQPVVGQGVKDV